MLDPEKEVPAKVTPLSHAEVRQALIEGHQTIRGGELPSHNRLRAAWCHVALEVAGGRASWQYNLGNIKTSDKDTSWRGAWYKLPAELLTKAPEEWPYQRAYGNAASGASDYWRLMYAKWPAALRAADGGDLYAFANELRRGGYYTAQADKYGAALTRWAEYYDRTWPAPGHGQAPWFALAAAVTVGALIWLQVK